MVCWRRRELTSSAVRTGCSGSSIVGALDDTEDVERETGVIYLRNAGEVPKGRPPKKDWACRGELSSERCLLVPRNSSPISLGAEMKKGD